MRIALVISAILATGISPAQENVWSLELLKRYASRVREDGFSCPPATRVTEVDPDIGGTASKVTCGPATTPVFGEEVAFRPTVRPDGSRWAEP
jgi:hypothetical protein